MKKRTKIDRRSLRIEGLEDRRVLASSAGWDGAGQSSVDLEYYIGQAPSGMSQAAFEAAIETALKAWSDVVDIDFTQTSRPGQANSLDFSAVRIDGSGGTLAQAYFPGDLNSGPLAGDVQFDASERWEVGNSLGSAAFDLVLVAAHEIGHALGLDHSDESSSILYPSITTNQSFVGLDDADVAAIRQLYAPEVTSNNDSGSSAGNSGGTTSNTQDTATPTTPQTPTTPTLNFGGNTRIKRFTQNSWFANWYQNSDRSESQWMAAPTNHNLFNPIDVNADDRVSPLDALLVINVLPNRGTTNTSIMVDTNGDGRVSPIDALLVINGLGKQHATTTITIDMSGVSPAVTVVMTPIDTGTDADTDTGTGTDAGTDTGTDTGTTDDSGTPADDSNDDSIDDSAGDSAGDTTDTDDNSSGDDTSGDDTTDDDSTGSDSDDTSGDDSSGDNSSDDDTADDDTSSDDTSGDTSGDSDPATDDCDDPVANEDDTVTGGTGIEDVANTNVVFIGLHFPRQHFGSRMGGWLSTESVDRLFERYDDNADDLLTEAEVPSGLWTSWANREVDTNADDAVSFDELTADVRARQQARFDLLDDDGDGLVTESEISARRWAKLSVADTNEDGGVSLDELLAYQATQADVRCNEDSVGAAGSGTAATALVTMIEVVNAQVHLFTSMAASLRSMARMFRR